MEEQKPHLSPAPEFVTQKNAPVSPTFRPFRLISLSILFVLVIVALGISSYLLASHTTTTPPTSQPHKAQAVTSPSPTPASGWHIYSYNKNGIAFSLTNKDNAFALAPEGWWGFNAIMITVIDLKNFNNDYINLGTEFQTNKYYSLATQPAQLQAYKDEQLHDLTKALQNGSSYTLPQDAEMHTLSKRATVKKYGTNYFLRIFPGNGEGCFCHRITYITQLNNQFVEISFAKSAVASAPGSSTPIPTNEVSVFSDAQFTALLQSNPDQLIQKIFGNIDSFMDTFTASTQPLTPTPTTALQRYTDTYFGYSLSYPNSWLLRRTYGPDIQKQAPTDVKSGIDLTNNLTSNSQTNTQATIVMNVLARHNVSDIQSWISQYDLNYPKDATKQTISFNGLQAIKYSNFMESNHPTEYLYFLSGNYAYRIQYWEQAGISETTRQIINSFRP